MFDIPTLCRFYLTIPMLHLVATSIVPLAKSGNAGALNPASLHAICSAQVRQHGVNTLLNLRERGPLLGLGGHALSREVLQQQALDKQLQCSSRRAVHAHVYGARCYIPITCCMPSMCSCADASTCCGAHRIVFWCVWWEYGPLVVDEHGADDLGLQVEKPTVG